MKTPLLTKIHDSFGFRQCSDCAELGWPLGMFDCAGDNVDCIDFRL